MKKKSAIARPRGFCQQKAADYEQQRDLPAIEGTSRLSPCLAVGALSPRQCLHTVCGLSSRGRWMAKPDRYGSTSLSGASFIVT